MSCVALAVQSCLAGVPGAVRVVAPAVNALVRAAPRASAVGGRLVHAAVRVGAVRIHSNGMTLVQVLARARARLAAACGQTFHSRIRVAVVRVTRLAVCRRSAVRDEVRRDHSRRADAALRVSTTIAFAICIASAIRTTVALESISEFFSTPRSSKSI